MLRLATRRAQRSSHQFACDLVRVARRDGDSLHSDAAGKILAVSIANATQWRAFMHCSTLGAPRWNRL
jgi:hypothetical protein